MMRAARAVRRWITVMFGFLRRELLDIAKQPRLLMILVLGPFAILLLFGGGRPLIGLDAAWVGRAGADHPFARRRGDEYRDDLGPLWADPGGSDGHWPR